jgi:hypothetical protein
MASFIVSLRTSNLALVVDVDTIGYFDNFQYIRPLNKVIIYLYIDLWSIWLLVNKASPIIKST